MPACGLDADDGDESEPTTTMSLKLLKGPTELRGNCYMGLSLQAAHPTRNHMIVAALFLINQCLLKNLKLAIKNEFQR